MSFWTNLCKILNLNMTAQLPRPDPSSQGTIRRANQSTPDTAQHNNASTPDTAHNDKASNTGSGFSPWSGTSSILTSFCGSGIRRRAGSTSIQSRRALTSVPHEIGQAQGTNTPSSQDGPNHTVLETSATHARRGHLGLGPQPSPCARMSGLSPHRDQPAGHFHLGQSHALLLTDHTYSTSNPRDHCGGNWPSSSHSTVLASRAASQPKSPLRGDPNSTGFGTSFVPQGSSSDETDLSGSSGTLLDSIAPPIYYQPMASLMASGTPYQPGPITFGGLNPKRNSTSAFDRLTSSMQQAGIHNTGGGLNNTEVGPVARIKRHFSPYYQGDIYLPANQSEDIADDLNCSLFIVNLPPRLTTHELLAAIHKLGPLGRIFAIHINGPELQRNHPGCAAKVVFFKRDVAHKFFTQCELNGFRVNGHNSRVMWNRIKTSEKPHLANSDASRVLLIGGPPTLVNSSTLTDFFHTKLEFQIDSIITHVQGSLGNEDAVIEYRFGSFRCQAQAAKMALARELPHIRCFFGKDPLEPEAYRPFEYFSFTENA